MTSDNDASTLCLQKKKTPTLTASEGLQDKKDEDEKHEEIDDEHSNVSGWTPLVVLGGVTCCFGSALPAGFNIGVMNNPAEIMQAFCNASFQQRYDVHLDETELNIIWGAVVSIFLIGGVTGSLLASWIADKYGRRGALAIGNLCGIVGAILFLLVPTLNSVEVLMLGRLMVGLSGGIATSVLPTYVTEIAPLKQRGAVGVLCQLGITVGVFFGQVAGLQTVLGTVDHWHLMLASFAPLCVISLIILRILPESPKYLYITRRKEDTAIQELRRLRNVNVTLLQKEIRDLREEATARTTMDTWTMRRVLSDPSVRLPLLLVSSLQLGQQLSGINAVFYYSNIIFKKSNLDATGAQYATLGTGLINIGMAVISVWMMSRFGRRLLFLSSSIASVVCLVVLCGSLKAIDSATFMPWLCTIAVLAYVLFYGIGLGPIPYFIGSELFEVGPRPAAMSLGSVCNWGGNFIVGMLFPPLETIMGPLVFLLFAISTTLVGLFARHYLPETRGVDTSLTAFRLSRGLNSRRQDIESS
ncbi:solute carrier family 2, facilitated glucose transporter member 1 [Diachasma alloeum]|uniref:solute carrier family 2, facilitated glucose transporter member 1 n=1 Tax=Diachasma alloeum TaxID=454923 RepID=UPI0007381BE3|nr:solute carrier family 2, facilitated glucose transporter member 1 [Diachasma alloeum]